MISSRQTVADLSSAQLEVARVVRSLRKKKDTKQKTRKNYNKLFDICKKSYEDSLKEVTLPSKGVKQPNVISAELALGVPLFVGLLQQSIQQGSSPLISIARNALSQLPSMCLSNSNQVVRDSLIRVRNFLAPYIFSRSGDSAAEIEEAAALLLELAIAEGSLSTALEVSLVFFDFPGKLSPAIFKTIRQFFTGTVRASAPENFSKILGLQCSPSKHGDEFSVSPIVECGLVQGKLACSKKDGFDYFQLVVGADLDETSQIVLGVSDGISDGNTDFENSMKFASLAVSAEDWILTIRGQVVKHLKLKISAGDVFGCALDLDASSRSTGAGDQSPGPTGNIEFFWNGVSVASEAIDLGQTTRVFPTVLIHGHATAAIQLAAPRPVKKSDKFDHVDVYWRFEGKSLSGRDVASLMLSRLHCKQSDFIDPSPSTFRSLLALLERINRPSDPPLPSDLADFLLSVILSSLAENLKAAETRPKSAKIDAGSVAETLSKIQTELLQIIDSREGSVVESAEVALANGMPLLFENMIQRHSQVQSLLSKHAAQSSLIRGERTMLLSLLRESTKPTSLYKLGTDLLKGGASADGLFETALLFLKLQHELAVSRPESTQKDRDAVLDSKKKIFLQSVIGGGVRVCVPHSDFDENGILFLIGSTEVPNPGTFLNPAISADPPVVVFKGVDPSVSPLTQVGAGSAAQIIDRQPAVNSWTPNSQEKAMYTIDLGENRRCIPTHYTMRRGGGVSKTTHWVFEGGNFVEGATLWTVLKEHTGDNTINGQSYLSHTWKIDNPQNDHFRLFRLRMTAPAHDGDWFFSVSQVEFYGKYFPSSELLSSAILREEEDLDAMVRKLALGSYMVFDGLVAGGKQMDISEKEVSVSRVHAAIVSQCLAFTHATKTALDVGTTDLPTCERELRASLAGFSDVIRYFPSHYPRPCEAAVSVLTSLVDLSRCLSDLVSRFADTVQLDSKTDFWGSAVLLDVARAITGLARSFLSQSSAPADEIDFEIVDLARNGKSAESIEFFNDAIFRETGTLGLTLDRCTSRVSSQNRIVIQTVRAAAAVALHHAGVVPNLMVSGESLTPDLLACVQDVVTMCSHINFSLAAAIQRQEGDDQRYEKACNPILTSYLSLLEFAPSGQLEDIKRVVKSVEKIATLIGLEETAIQNFASARTARAQQLWIALESFQNLLCNDLVPEGTKRHALKRLAHSLQPTLAVEEGASASATSAEPSPPPSHILDETRGAPLVVQIVIRNIFGEIIGFLVRLLSDATADSSLRLSAGRALVCPHTLESIQMLLAADLPTVIASLVAETTNRQAQVCLAAGLIGKDGSEAVLEDEMNIEMMRLVGALACVTTTQASFFPTATLTKTFMPKMLDVISSSLLLWGRSPDLVSQEKETKPPKIVQTRFVWDAARSFSDVVITNNGLSSMRSNSNGWGAVNATPGIRTGRHFIEVSFSGTSSDYLYLGIAYADCPLNDNYVRNNIVMRRSGPIRRHSDQIADVEGWGMGDKMGIGVDMEARTVHWFKNGRLLNVTTDINEGREIFFHASFGSSDLIITLSEFPTPPPEFPIAGLARQADPKNDDEVTADNLTRILTMPLISTLFLVTHDGECRRLLQKDSLLTDWLRLVESKDEAIATQALRLVGHVAKNWDDISESTSRDVIQRLLSIASSLSLPASLTVEALRILGTKFDSAVWSQLVMARSRKSIEAVCDLLRASRGDSASSSQKPIFSETSSLVSASETVALAISALSLMGGMRDELGDGEAATCLHPISPDESLLSLLEILFNNFGVALPGSAPVENSPEPPLWYFTLRSYALKVLSVWSADACFADLLIRSPHFGKLLTIGTSASKMPLRSELSFAELEAKAVALTKALRSSEVETKEEAAPEVVEAAPVVSPDEADLARPEIEILAGMGFRYEWCLQALRKNSWNVERAVNWIFENMSQLEADSAAAAPATATKKDEATLLPSTPKNIWEHLLVPADEWDSVPRGNMFDTTGLKSTIDTTSLLVKERPAVLAIQQRASKKARKMNWQDRNFIAKTLKSFEESGRDVSKILMDTETTIAIWHARHSLIRVLISGAKAGSKEIQSAKSSVLLLRLLSSTWEILVAPPIASSHIPSVADEMVSSLEELITMCIATEQHEPLLNEIVTQLKWELSLAAPDRTPSVETKTTRPHHILESDHEYADNMNIQGHVCIPGARKLLLTLDKRCETESGCDKFRIYRSPDRKNRVFKFHGSSWGKTKIVEGSDLYWRFTSDRSKTYWGWRILVEDADHPDPELQERFLSESTTVKPKAVLPSDRCSYTVTGVSYINQARYICQTCDNEGGSLLMCEVCAKVCHEGHKLGPVAMNECFCDCGAGVMENACCMMTSPLPEAQRVMRPSLPSVAWLLKIAQLRMILVTDSSRQLNIESIAELALFNALISNQVPVRMELMRLVADLASKLPAGAIPFSGPARDLICGPLRSLVTQQLRLEFVDLGREGRLFFSKYARSLFRAAAALSKDDVLTADTTPDNIFVEFLQTKQLLDCISNSRGLPQWFIDTLPISNRKSASETPGIPAFILGPDQREGADVTLLAGASTYFQNQDMTKFSIAAKPSTMTTVVGSTIAKRGSFMFEVRVGGRDGVVGLGWARKLAGAWDQSLFIGGDSNSWGLCTKKGNTSGATLRHADSTVADVTLPTAIIPGSVLGCWIDLSAGRIGFSLNGEIISNVFSELPTDGSGMVPVVSFGDFSGCLNFGGSSDSTRGFWFPLTVHSQPARSLNNVDAPTPDEQPSTIEDLHVGDRIRLIWNPDELKRLAEGHGGWAPDMRKSVGLEGEVTEKSSSTSVRVRTVDGASYVYNPKACMRVSVSPQIVDDLAPEDWDSDGGIHAWSLEQDIQLVTLANEHARIQPDLRNGPKDIPAKTFLAQTPPSTNLVFSPKSSPAAESPDRASLVGTGISRSVSEEQRMSLLDTKSISSLRARFVVLKRLNISLEKYFSILFLDQDCDDETTAQLVQIKQIIFSQIKDKFLRSVVGATMTQTERPTISINRGIAIRDSQIAVKRGTCKREGLTSVFGQIFSAMQSIHPNKLRVAERIFKVALAGEGATDAGGPYRECISNSCADLMSAATPLFILCPNGRGGEGYGRDRYIPNPKSSSPVCMKMFHFVGVLLGVAIRTKHPLELFISNIFWKEIIGEKLTVADLDNFDHGIVRHLSSHVKNVHDVSTWESLEHTWSIPSADGSTIDIRPNGADSPVAFQDRDEYFDACVEIRLREMSAQIKAIRDGLSLIVPLGALSLLTSKELELAVCGQEEIDLALLKSNTTYSRCAATDKGVKRFWRCLESFTHEDRRQFLEFVWGRTRLPRLSESWSQKFDLSVTNTGSSGGDMRLPTASTCSFSAVIPSYSSATIMRKKILYAIHNTRIIDRDGNASGTFGEVIAEDDEDGLGETTAPQGLTRVPTLEIDSDSDTAPAQ